jgi:prepilin-type N-terminal cleavage/methylation domain-containing protein
MQQYVNKKEAGFTLLEVLLAILLLASASLLLLVKLPDNFQELRLERSSAELVADLRGVQQSAITENCWYQIRFYPATDEYMIFRQGKFVRTVKLQSGVSFGGSIA